MVNENLLRIEKNKLLEKKIRLLKKLKNYINIQNEEIKDIDNQLNVILQTSNFTAICDSCGILKYKNELDLVTIKDMKKQYING